MFPLPLNAVQSAAFPFIVPEKEVSFPTQVIFSKLHLNFEVLTLSASDIEKIRTPFSTLLAPHDTPHSSTVNSKILPVLRDIVAVFDKILMVNTLTLAFQSSDLFNQSVPCLYTRFFMSREQLTDLFEVLTLVQALLPADFALSELKETSTPNTKLFTQLVFMVKASLDQFLYLQHQQFSHLSDLHNNILPSQFLANLKEVDCLQPTLLEKFSLTSIHPHKKGVLVEISVVQNLKSQTYLLWRSIPLRHFILDMGPFPWLTSKQDDSTFFFIPCAEVLFGNADCPLNPVASPCPLALKYKHLNHIMENCPFISTTSITPLLSLVGLIIPEYKYLYFNNTLNIDEKVIVHIPRNDLNLPLFVKTKFTITLDNLHEQFYFGPNSIENDLKLYDISSSDLDMFLSHFVPILSLPNIINSTLGTTLLLLSTAFLLF